MKNTAEKRYLKTEGKMWSGYARTSLAYSRDSAETKKGGEDACINGNVLL